MVRTSQSLFASAHDLLGIDERPDISYRASVGPHSFPGVLAPVRIRFAVWNGRASGSTAMWDSAIWDSSYLSRHGAVAWLSVRMGEDNGQKEAI